MRSIEYLYYKYFRFQQRVGNGSIAPVMAAQIIALLFFFLGLDVLMIVVYLFGRLVWLPPVEFVVAILVAMMGLSYWRLAARGRYRAIVSLYEYENADERRRGTLYASLIPAGLLLIFAGFLFLFAVYPSKNRRVSVRKKFPSEFYGETIGEALSHGNSTVLKLLKDGRFAK